MLDDHGDACMLFIPIKGEQHGTGGEVADGFSHTLYRLSFEVIQMAEVLTRCVTTFHTRGFHGGCVVVVERTTKCYQV